MIKKYYAWKHPECNGINPEWIEMTGKEFLAFKRRTENKNRKFVALADPEMETQTIFLEATKSEYDRWHREESREFRRKDSQKGIHYLLVSIDDQVFSDGNSTFEDILPDEETDIESEVLSTCFIEELLSAVSQLSDTEKALVDICFLNNKDNLSERQLAKKIGIPLMTLNNQKRAILKKIKKILVQK